MAGQRLGDRGGSIGVSLLDALAHTPVEQSSPLLQEGAVSDLASERVPERVLAIREEPSLIEKLRPEKLTDLSVELFLRQVHGALQQLEGHVHPDHRCALEQTLALDR